MAYTTATLNLIGTGTIDNSVGGSKRWTYSHATETLATVIGAGYISDATKKGILVGDVVDYFKTGTVSVFKLKVASISSGAATLAAIDLAASGTMSIGAATTDLLGFYGLATPIAQQVGAAQAAVATSVVTTAATTTSPWGYATSTQADAVSAQVVLLRTLVNELRADLVALNLIKGAA